MKRLLSSTLGTMLLVTVCTPSAPLHTFAPIALPALPRQGNANVHKIAEAGIQFTVPSGWEVKTDKEGAVKVSPKAGGNAQIAFVDLPVAADLNSDDRQGLFDTLVEKSKAADLKLGDYNDSDTLGGMKVSIRRYTGNELQGAYVLLSAEKYVFIIIAIKKAIGDSLDDDIGAIMKSIKRIT